MVVLILILPVNDLIDYVAQKFYNAKPSQSYVNVNYSIVHLQVLRRPSFFYMLVNRCTSLLKHADINGFII